MVNHLEGLEDGLNVIKHGDRGFMHIYIYDGVIINMTLFNCKISKKKTRTKSGLSLVNLDIKNDEVFA